MKTMKKFFVTALSALLLVSNVGAAASCGGSKVDKVDFGNTTVAVVPYDGSKVTVTFYHTMGATLRSVLDRYVKKFNEIYPNITIKHSSKGDYLGVRDQISTEINASTSPTMAYCYPDHVALYNEAKATVALDGYINSTEVVSSTNEILGLTAEQKADYVEAYYNEGKVYGDDLMYTLPFIKSTEVLYYNKTFFEANNLSVPQTWDDMEQLCIKIMELDAAAKVEFDAAEQAKKEQDSKYNVKKYPQNYPFGYDSEANWFITLCEQYASPYTSATGEKFRFNNETNWGFVEKFKGWYDKGWFTTEELNGGYTSSLFTETAPEKSKSYMTIGSSGGASYQTAPKFEGTDEYKFEVGVAPIPQYDLNNKKTISQGPSICLFKKNNPQEVAAAWLFTKYLTTSVEFQASFSIVSGYAPVIKSVEQNETYKEDFLDTADGYGNVMASCVLQSIAQKDTCFISPAFLGSSMARDEVGVLLQTVFANKPTSGQSMTDYIKKEFQNTMDTLNYYYGNK